MSKTLKQQWDNGLMATPGSSLFVFPHRGPLTRWAHSHQKVADLSLTAIYVLITIATSNVLSGSVNSLTKLSLAVAAASALALLIRSSLPAVAPAIAIFFPLLIAVSTHLNIGTFTATHPLLIGPGISPIEPAAPFIIIATSAYALRPVQSWLWALTATIVLAANAYLFFGTSTENYFIFVPVAILMGLAQLLGLNLRSTALRLADAEARASRLALENEQREQLAVAAERTRIAREMHDVVAHSLAIMITMADGATASFDKKPEVARKAIEQVAITGRAALADTRRLVGVLRDETDATTQSPTNVSKNDAPTLGDLNVTFENKEAPQNNHPPVKNALNSGKTEKTEEDLKAEIAPELVCDPSLAAMPTTPQPGSHDVLELVERFQKAGLPVKFKRIGNPLPDNPGLQLAVFRIVQESLTNILRYAPATTTISVFIRRSIGNVEVVIENAKDPTAVANPGSGKGLIGMRERVAVYDGTVDSGPTEFGWCTRAVLNWQEEEGTQLWEIPQ